MTDWMRYVSYGAVQCHHEYALYELQHLSQSREEVTGFSEDRIEEEQNSQLQDETCHKTEETCLKKDRTVKQ